MKYQKKPIIVEAEPVSVIVGSFRSNWNSAPEWIHNAWERGELCVAETYIMVRTLEGWMRGEISDMLIQGVKGELYPCKVDIFSATYDPVYK